MTIRKLKLNIFLIHLRTGLVGSLISFQIMPVTVIVTTYIIAIKKQELRNDF